MLKWYKRTDFEEMRSNISKHALKGEDIKHDKLKLQRE
jgi:(2Fe-2S) ferredoxin